MEFEELYEKLLDEHGEAIAIKQNKFKLQRIFIIGLFAVGFLAMIFMYFWIAEEVLDIPENFMIEVAVFSVLAIILISILGKCLGRISKSLNLYYKENVVSHFVSMVDSNFNYSAKSDSSQKEIAESQYNSEFSDSEALQAGTKFERMTDNIVGTVKSYPISICNILAKNKLFYFEGLFVHIKTDKDMPGYTQVASSLRNYMFKKRAFSNLNIGNMHRAESPLVIEPSDRRRMDHSEFEKYFEVGSNDQIVAMQYLTTDIMEHMVEFRKTYDIVFDFVWRGKDVFIRFNLAQMFKPTMSDPICRESLEKCMAILTFVLTFNELVARTIEETAI